MSHRSGSVDGLMNNGNRAAGRNSGTSSPVCESLYNTSKSRSLEAQHSLEEEEDGDGEDGDQEDAAATAGGDKLVIGIAAQSRGVAKRSSSSSSSSSGGGGGGGNDIKRPKTVVA